MQNNPDAASPHLAILAFDPAHPDRNEICRLVRAARSIDPSARFRAVGVLSPRDLQLPSLDQRKQGHRAFRTLPTATDLLGPAPLSQPEADLRDAQILLAQNPSTKDAAHAVLQYGLHEKASMVVMSTHGRRWLEKWRLGSFSETFLLNSRMPVLVLSPQARIPEQVNVMLHPSDLARSNEKFFLCAVRRAQALGCRLILYHSRPAVEPILLTALGGRIDSEYLHQAWADEETHVRFVGKRWAAKAQAAGINCEFVMDKLLDSVAVAVREYCEHQAIDVLHLGTPPVDGGRKLGPTIKSLIATAPCPVIIETRIEVNKESRPVAPTAEAPVTFAPDVGAAAH